MTQEARTRNTHTSLQVTLLCWLPEELPCALDATPRFVKLPFPETHLPGGQGGADNFLSCGSIPLAWTKLRMLVAVGSAHNCAGKGQGKYDEAIFPAASFLAHGKMQGGKA